ncbi:zinc finger, SWIM-type [Lentisphaera araneosa HTCC2155]|uniref:Zinc finger, SWIM-type n=1 Tax=Lentisphaera araneosa HTCC2155 TaxID=313628 RepID=A6DIK7_9BACT|nr:SWIM zinc finger family protein [Lentisphaera araneosa]EDM28293.1 zinc finger, SWIM-type [Lentisphaera araneosa HTCC2155]
MSRYGNYGGFGEYESKAQKLAKSKKKIAALKKKNPDIEPILIEGRLLARTWWGKAWNANLEKYSDLSNRLERGRSYVRNGSILDLQIHAGYITAQIMGSGSSIYKCRVDISPLSEKTWQIIKKQSSGSIASIGELLSGKFPKEMQELFAAKSDGLFPASSEIKKSCDCPDYASLCKHLAATLYGIGARFDHKPELIFTLRGIDSSELVSAVVESHKDDLISRAKKANKERQLKLKDKQLSKLFDIDFEMPD